MLDALWAGAGTHLTSRTMITTVMMATMIARITAITAAIMAGVSPPLVGSASRTPLTGSEEVGEEGIERISGTRFRK